MYCICYNKDKEDWEVEYRCSSQSMGHHLVLWLLGKFPCFCPFDDCSDCYHCDEESYIYLWVGCNFLLCLHY